MIVVVENKSLKSITESSNNELSKYGSFASFLVQEADDEPAPRRNMKVIKINSRHRTDYSAGSEDLATPPEDPEPQEPEPEVGTGEEEPVPDEGADAEEDYSAGSEDLATPPEDPNPAPDDGGEAATIEPEDGGGEEEPAPDEGGGEGEEDYSAGSEDLANPPEDGGGEEAPQDDENNDQDQGGSNNNDMDLDQGRKLILFRDYKNLYNNIDEFIEKLDKLPRTDPSENTIFKKCSKHLRKLKSMLYDWMILRFQNKSYFQSRYFFQQAVVSCQLVVNTINKLAVIKAKKSK